MSQEDELVQERRRHLDELIALGVRPYPNRFDRTGSIAALVAAHGGRTGEELEAAPIEVTTAGRVLAIRSFGKASFLALSDGLSRLQVYVHARTRCPSWISGSSGCSTWATMSASRGTCSGRGPASSRSGRGGSSSSPSATGRCRRSGTA